MTAREADKRSYDSFYREREDRMWGLKFDTTDLRWLKPDDVFQNGDMVWNNRPGWTGVEAEYFGRTVGRRCMPATPIGAKTRNAKQLFGEPYEPFANESADDLLHFNRTDIGEFRKEHTLLLDFRWLHCGEKLIEGDMILRPEENWLTLNNEHWWCGRIIPRELIRWLPQGCIFREPYEPRDYGTNGKALITPGQVTSVNVVAGAGYSTDGSYYGVYDDPEARFRQRVSVWRPSRPEDFYGSYLDQAPKSNQVNTYPQGLKPPSKPLVVPARPVTGERVKRVFNFDD